FSPEGGQDSTLNTDGIASTVITTTSYATASRLIRDSAGNYVIAGSVGPNSNYVLARFTSTGALDTSFGAAGATPGMVIPFNFPAVTNAMGLALQSDGKLLFAATLKSSGTYFGLMRLTTDGVPDPSFGNNGLRGYDAVGSYDLARSQSADVAISPDG